MSPGDGVSLQPFEGGALNILSSGLVFLEKLHVSLAVSSVFVGISVIGEKLGKAFDMMGF